MFSVQDLMMSHSVLFSLCYPYLLSLKSSAHSPSQLADYYLDKVTRKSQRMSKRDRHLGNIENNAIATLIRGESLKSMTTSGLFLGGFALLKQSKLQSTVSIKQVGLYCLRLRLMMAIAILCHLDLRQATTRHQLSLLIQSVPVAECDLPLSLPQLPVGFISQYRNMAICNRLPKKPWLVCLHFISKLTMDGMITYRLGLKAHKQFSSHYLSQRPVNALKAC